MLILASNNDRLQIVTGAAGSIDVHASWMDNVSGAVAPGRTNTAISTAATTTVVQPPASGNQRNVKTLQIRNKGSSSNDITIIHTDGTTPVELHKVALAPGRSIEYVDEHGFKPESVRLVLQKFTTPGTVVYTPSPGMAYCIIEAIGGGGGGGDSAWGLGRGGGGGGGSGAYSRKLATAADVGGSQNITVGAGGGAGVSGGKGGDTSVGGLCKANGGFGGGGSLNGNNTPLGGDGGLVAGGIGDILSAGSPGEQGGYVLWNPNDPFEDSPSVIPGGGRGGSGFFGGGANIPAVGLSGSLPGRQGGQYGGGGSGSVSNTTGGFIGSGPGAAGAVFITEYCLP